MVLFFILLFLIILIAMIDFVPQFMTWQSRIHIGRHQNREIWVSKLTEKSKKWLQKTPTVKLTDNDRLIIIDILKGNYKKNAIQHWQEAALILGMSQAYSTTGDASIKKSIDNYLATKFDASGNWKNVPTEIDGVILAYAILNLDWIDKKHYKPAFDQMWQLLQKLVGEDGTICYRKHVQDFRFVDTIGFVCPFLINYGQEFGVDDAVNLGIRQIQAFNTYGMDANFVPCHTYRASDNICVGLFGWGRGLGWYAIGLIDSWSALNDTHPAKNELAAAVTKFAKMAMGYQNPQGSWSWIISADHLRKDSSTTATLAYFLSAASQIPEISQACVDSKEKALQYLTKSTRRDGAIDFSQGDTKGIGVYSQHFDILPFTQGFALRTAYVAI